MMLFIVHGDWVFICARLHGDGGVVEGPDGCVYEGGLDMKMA